MLKNVLIEFCRKQSKYMFDERILLIIFIILKNQVPKLIDTLSQ